MHSDRGGNFVLKEQFFTGWQATVDGQAVPIERWDGTFQSVRVPSGDHLVSFNFRPRSVVIGAIISLLTAIALAFVALWKPRLTPSRSVV